MKKLKLKSQSKSSGQIIVVLIIVLGLVGVGFWWLFSNKQEMAREGKAFAKEATQRIIQGDANFFSSHLSPASRMNFPPSVLQETFADITKRGAPVGPVDVQGDIKFQSQFFEPRGDLRARINYQATYADIYLSISHPVGRWQIDDFRFLPQAER